MTSADGPTTGRVPTRPGRAGGSGLAGDHRVDRRGLAGLRPRAPLVDPHDPVVAVGAGIAFCPLYGFHMILVGLCTWAFKLNFVALLAGALINNPWTIVPVLGATYWTGAILLGRSETPAFDWSELGFRAIYEQVMPYAVPFALGERDSTIGSWRVPAGG